MDEKKYIEQYQFLRLSRIDIEQAIQTLNLLKRYKGKDVRYALLRDFVVAYSRPFVGSNGHEIKKHILKLKYVPVDRRKLHGEIIDKRHQLFAHNDLQYRKPTVANLSTLDKPWFPMSFRGFDYDQLDEKYVDMLVLAEAVLSKIDDGVAQMEPRLLSLSQQLPKKLYFT